MSGKNFFKIKYYIFLLLIVNIYYTLKNHKCKTYFLKFLKFDFLKIYIE